jgi:hypothetical protein
MFRVVSVYKLIYGYINVVRLTNCVEDILGVRNLKHQKLIIQEDSTPFCFRWDNHAFIHEPQCQTKPNRSQWQFLIDFIFS